jgi:hypothetical protein
MIAKPARPDRAIRQATIAELREEGCICAVKVVVLQRSASDGIPRVKVGHAPDCPWLLERGGKGVALRGMADRRSVPREEDAA